MSGNDFQNSTKRETAEVDPHKFHHLDLDFGLWDRSRVFKIFPFVITGEHWTNLTGDWNVCLSTQTSVNYLFWLVEQSNTWDGPISVSVFVPDVDYTIAVLMIKYMRTCFPKIREQVTFHMVFPNVMPPRFAETDILEFDCSRHENVNDEIVELIRTDELIKVLEVARYPQNLLRNVARQGCQSSYCFTPDIDMISIRNFSVNLNSFLMRDSIQKCKKCAFVVPTYEISTRAPTNPQTKTELIKYVRRRWAQRFHIRIYKANQANSNLKVWEKLPQTTGLNIAYNITTWMKHWEPIYVTKSNVLSFDERFIGYGFTRNSQVGLIHYLQLL